MSEEKLALTNEQLGRLFAAVQAERMQDHEKELPFEFKNLSKEELEMFYGYIWSPETPVCGERRDFLRSFMAQINREFVWGHLTMEETYGILYALKKEADQRFKVQPE